MQDFGADLTVRNGPGRSFDQLLNMSGVPGERGRPPVIPPQCPPWPAVSTEHSS